MKHETPAAEMRAWIKERTTDKKSVNAPALARKMIKHFEKDEEFVVAFFREHGYATAYRLVIETIQRTRGRASVVQLGDEVVDRDEFEKRSKAFLSRWDRWLEHVGDKHVRLMDMKRSDLLAAAQIRRERADNELEIAQLWESLAERLEGSQTVREAFTPEEIDRVKASLDREVA